MTVLDILKSEQIKKPEAEIILAQVLNKDRSFLYSHPEYKLRKGQISQFTSASISRKKNKPLAYILGYREFYGLKFIVNENVLIPRPETEDLIEKVINFVQNSLSNKRVTICDVGTGSGCIAITLARYLKSARIYAVDISSLALETAEKNAKSNKVLSKVNFLQGDLLSPLPEKVDIVVANLPYVPSSRLKNLKSEIKDWEPKIALDGGKNGMVVYNRLFKQSTNYLEKNGVIFYELDGDVCKKTY